MFSSNNIAEYYEEFHQVLDYQKEFYDELAQNYPHPVKYLRVGCGAGLFEHQLAKEGADVTGIDSHPDLIHSANLRRRTQLMALHFFQMSQVEMGHFLGKGFYNIISCLDSRITILHDRTLIRKFFYDCKQLLRENGTLVISVHNFNRFNQPTSKMPTIESVRAKLFSTITYQQDGTALLNQEVESGNGRMISIYQNEKIYPLKPEEIVEFAKEAGFTDIQLYSDFRKNPFTGTEEKVVAVIK